MSPPITLIGGFSLRTSRLFHCQAGCTFAVAIILLPHTEWNLILAASLLATLPIVALFAFFQRYIVESIKMAALKP
jgi:ABC-type glycerol-3-phosphate transport system permease component